MIPQETVNKILDSAQIVDVVRDFVTLKKAGADYKACCPFHNEKTPSFSVSPSKGIYKCFGCGKSGTAIGFVLVGALRNEPTVDAVEVVRCKDCKHWSDSWVAPDGKHTHGECYIEDADDVIVGRWGDDFCSYGERRT